ncbi:MAG: hypothetical protein JXA10_05685 [Anaerolineae bacterium]|nr:hypothetical protein [Anaerolineae bacterium]
MAKLINKLNTLVQSSVRGVLGNDPDRRYRRSLPKLGQHMDREIVALRDQINAALDDQDSMIAAITVMQQQIADWDRQADAALQRGDEAGARHTIRQIQMQQQRLTMLQAELEQHQLSTSELISQVNALEAIVAEAQQHDLAADRVGAAEADTVDDESLSSRLRNARQQATQEMEQVQSTEPVAAPQEMDEQAIEDDLARRRARLSQ